MDAGLFKKTVTEVSEGIYISLNEVSPQSESINSTRECENASRVINIQSRLIQLPIQRIVNERLSVFKKLVDSKRPDVPPILLRYVV